MLSKHTIHSIGFLSITTCTKCERECEIYTFSIPRTKISNSNFENMKINERCMNVWLIWKEIRM